jgi:hypothetical protein
LLDNGEVTQHANDHHEGHGAECDASGDGEIGSVWLSHVNVGACGRPHWRARREWRRLSGGANPKREAAHHALWA